MNFWGYIFLVVVALGFIIGLRAIAQGSKAITSETRPGVLFAGLFFAVLTIGVLQWLPFFLAVEYPLNWAAWVLVAWFAWSFFYSTYSVFTGRPAKPARTGWSAAWRIGRLVLMHGGIVALFLVACGVL
jgi:hypothetical protein